MGLPARSRFNRPGGLSHMWLGEGSSVDQVIDLKALLVEREDCDAGTIQKLREGLAQGGTQFKALKEVNDTLRKRLEAPRRPWPKNCT